MNTDTRADVELELCWGTVWGASLPELIDAAGQADFAAITVNPAMYADARAAGITDAELRSRLADNGLRVTVIDPLIRPLPGVPTDLAAFPDRLHPLVRADLDDCLRAAEALGATKLNLAQVLGAAVEPAVMAGAIADLVRRSSVHGIDLSIEFAPHSHGISDLRSAVEILALVDSPHLGITFDTFHFHRNATPSAELEALSPGVVLALQVSDTLDPPPGHSPKPGEDRLLPGEGDIPLADLVSRVVARNPGVPVGVEVMSSRLLELGVTRAAQVAGETTRRALWGG